MEECEREGELVRKVEECEREGDCNGEGEVREGEEDTVLLEERLTLAEVPVKGGERVTRGENCS